MGHSDLILHQILGRPDPQGNPQWTQVRARAGSGQWRLAPQPDEASFMRRELENGPNSSPQSPI